MFFESGGDDGGGNPFEGAGMSLGILEGHNVKRVSDVRAWGEWFEKADRRVAQTHLGARCWVSTVFLGIDHGWRGRVAWFETCVFRNGDGGEVGDRYATWNEAESGHGCAVRIERAGFWAWASELGTGELVRVRVLNVSEGGSEVFTTGGAFPVSRVYRSRRRVPFRDSTWRRHMPWSFG